MKVRTSLLILLLALTPGIAVTSFAGQQEPFPGDMAMTGEWHGEEVAAKNGEVWLALVQDDSGYALREVVIAVELVEDVIVDTPPAKTGRKISGPDGVDPLVLLRHLPQLGPGPVATAELTHREFNSMQPTGIYFDGMPFELTLECGEETLGWEQADCPLQLVGEGRRQTLQSYPVNRPCTDEATIASEAFPRVLWAGDLDRDGRLDLLVDLANHYNVSEPTLLLSTLAGPGELVRPAAVFRTTGC